MTKQETITKFRKSAKDTGSSSVQIALLTEQIKSVSEHLKTYKKDFSSRVGLMKMVGRRRRLLTYLKRTDLDEYNKLLKRLELRK
jgi:small subunit ribosomal protein S15